MTERNGKECGTLRDVQIDVPHHVPQDITLGKKGLQRLRYIAGRLPYSLRAEKKEKECV